MKYFYPSLLISCLLLAFQTNTKAAADVTLTSIAVAAAGVNQGSVNNIVYIVKMDVATQAATVNNVHFTLNGTHDANDLTTVNVFFNPTAPTIAGSISNNQAVATFVAPHTYDVPVSRLLAAGTSGYFIITVSINSTATDNNTIKINGATGPVVFGFTAAPNIINNQSDAAGIQTIQAADITLTSTVVPAANVNQGSVNNIVYIVKIVVATEPVTINNVQFILSGTHDANDLTVVNVFFNPIAPTLAGAISNNQAVATFAAPHTYDVPVSSALAAGTSGYFIITASINSTATDNNTIQINGAANPVVFGFTTAPNITNNQTNAAGPFTIQAADVTLTSNAIAAANVNQGSVNNIVYIVKIDVATKPVAINNVQFILSGTHDANDLTVVNVFFNPIAPTLAGAISNNQAVATFAAPHTYDVPVSSALAAGTSGYFIITASINSTATDNNTIQINGATNPVVFGFTTAPNITNNQTNAAGIQTIQAPGITLTSNAVSSATVIPNSTNNIVYIAKMNVATEDVTVNNVYFTLNGTHDANDLTVVNVFFNPTAPTLVGSISNNQAVATFAAPHIYDVPVSRPLAAGTTGYFIITVSINSIATIGSTITINGATVPVVFGFTTNPNITNNQTNASGTLTIQSLLPVSLVTFTARAINNKVQLNWETSSEINNAFFEIERSADGFNFKAIGKVKGNGTSTLIHNYGFADEVPAYGNNYYRLKQTDIDGHFEYSNIVKVSFSIKELVMGNVYPNPAKDVLTYSIFSPENKQLLLHLSDISGRILINKMITITKGTNQLQLNISRFESGNYQMSIINMDTNVRLNKQVIILR
ncbi:MAG: T9SS type A sorting domain-containing protein [Ferruginibacter sp.]